MEQKKIIKHIKYMLLISLVDIIASQFYLGVLVEGFRITLAVVFFPVFLYLYKELNPIITFLVIGIIGVMSRSFMTFLIHYNFHEAFYISYQEMTFYVIYGVLYYYMYHIKKDKNLKTWFITIWVCDFTSNIGEVITRVLVGSDENIIYISGILVVVALLRSGISLLILYFLKNYRLVIVREEHKDKYMRLVSLAVDLKGEIYFMNKNIDYLENVMNNAYRLYESFSDKKGMDDLKTMSLSIAKDVHEIKKDYISVIRGIEHITDNKIENSMMSLKDIIDILRDSTRKYLEIENIDIDTVFSMESNFYINDHYEIMSVLKNLINNAIEAVVLKGDKGTIKLEQLNGDAEYIFRVTDSGMGVKDRDLEFIFKPGFSTKFNEKTGDINRGIGLTLVKSLVENKFRGKISLVSKYKEGTTIEVRIPKERLEG